MAGKPLLERLSPLVNSLTVMNYRTDPWQIQEQALPFLVWGQHYEKGVCIALEIGPIAEETRLRFHRTRQGELWAVPIGHQGPIDSYASR
ncbi:hypothetical protein CCP3SC1_1450009 [Gammaproteobacteria bacterium]